MYVMLTLHDCLRMESAESKGSYIYMFVENCWAVKVLKTLFMTESQRT